MSMEIVQVVIDVLLAIGVALALIPSVRENRIYKGIMDFIKSFKKKD